MTCIRYKYIVARERKKTSVNEEKCMDSPGK